MSYFRTKTKKFGLGDDVAALPTPIKTMTPTSPVAYKLIPQLMAAVSTPKADSITVQSIPPSSIPQSQMDIAYQKMLADKAAGLISEPTPAQYAAMVAAKDGSAMTAKIMADATPSLSPLTIPATPVSATVPATFVPLTNQAPKVASTQPILPSNDAALFPTLSASVPWGTPATQVPAKTQATFVPNRTRAPFVPQEATAPRMPLTTTTITQTPPTLRENTSIYIVNPPPTTPPAAPPTIDNLMPYDGGTRFSSGSGGGGGGGGLLPDPDVAEDISSVPGVSKKKFPWWLLIAAGVGYYYYKKK